MAAIAAIVILLTLAKVAAMAWFWRRHGDPRPIDPAEDADLSGWG